MGASPAEPTASDSPVRVLFVSTQREPPLGADTAVHLEIIGALDRSRVEVHAACVVGRRGRPTPTYRRLRSLPDVEIVDVSLGRETVDGSRLGRLLVVLSLVPAIWGVLKLAVYIRRHRIEVIHTSDRPREAAVCVLLARLTSARTIVHVHVGFDPGWMRRTQQWAIHHADALIAISDFVADTLRAAGCAPESLHVVVNGIALDRWQPGQRREITRSALGLDDTATVVLTVCRLFRSKGVTELVQALIDLRDDVPDALLLVVGREMEAGYVDELRDMARADGIEDRVRFLGQRDDVPDLMAAADVFAMPSTHEPFGLVYAEAMAMALPVVALGNGGTVEVVLDGVTGLLSDLGDQSGLAANLRALLTDPARRAAYGADGRRRVEERFTAERMAADVADVYGVVGRGEQFGSGRRPDGSEDPVRATDRAGAGSSGIDAAGFAEAMDRDGYVVMRGVVSPERLTSFGTELLAEFDRLVQEGLPFEGGGLLSGHLNCFPGEKARFIYDEILDQGVVDLVRSYRPEIADSVRPTLNFNLPGSVAQHYHMDDAFLREFLICNIAVVDTDLFNGALDVLPGTNRRYYEFWRYALERKYRLSTRVPLEVGDVVIRTSNLWHRGMPNRSSTPRPMMAITFGEIEDPSVDPFSTNGGEIEFYPNWFRTSRLGRLRERTFVRAPLTYSSYRFLTSLHGKRGYESW